MIFVTGGTGLVGGHLLYYLSSSGHSVKALKRESSDLEGTYKIFTQYPSAESAWKNIEWVNGDVLEKTSLEEYIKQADCIYHCAAVVSFAGADRAKLLEINLQGTENTIDLCFKYQKRLCYVSSVAAVGDAIHDEDIIDENTPLNIGRLRSAYSQSKMASEDVVRTYICKGLDAVIVNPSIILGAGHWGKSSSKLFMTASKGIPFYTNGMSGYVDVRDVVQLMIRLTDKKEISGERYILNGGNYSYKELFTTIAHVTGHKSPFINMRPWMTSLAWRTMAIFGRLTGKKPAFTQETARSSQRRSRYSSDKILSLFPDYRFYTLEETIENINNQWKKENT